ncbi:MAG: hypothetical protein EAZ74_03695 [Alphaproteobacteria bacterium]|nr:MAG: hypothetical protein EAY76_06200 [Alphaproteobacteria bacterium]TAF14528.1 MAG: hypothetical protein EAZ74_03695 [Alphaproteobacteria bacterium]TAF39180.1 MAG: hypothetical protein EAZ66_05160 [Alphaproteobacteria bacterium]TAF74907.1 MAG: hypothetical protein EAZ52_07975 [Alphaproteobacteria bacterium]
MNIHVAIIAEKNDLTALGVASELNDLGVESTTLNYLDLRTVTHDFQRGFPKSFSSLWLRWLKTRPTETLVEKHDHVEMQAAFTGLLLEADVPTVPTPLCNLKARNKLIQLRRAEKHFNVPKWIFSSEKSVISESFSWGNQSIIYKPLSASLIDLEDKLFAQAKPREIQLDQIIHYGESDDTAPLFLQQRIDSVADIRVVIIGRKVFAVRIQKNSDILDSRLEWLDSAENYSLVQLPMALHDAILAYQAELGLNFGCMDFLVDKQGDYWFLEVNVGGQFSWLQFMLARQGIDCNLSKEVALLLAGKEPLLVV